MLGRICVPIHNATGELVAYAGRWPGDPPEGTERWLLPPGFHKALELWNLHRVKHCKHLVVVEGFFDAIRLHSLRVPAVALMGSSISEEQVALLSAHCPALRFLTIMGTPLALLTPDLTSGVLLGPGQSGRAPQN